MTEGALADESARFARTIQRTLDGVLPGDRRIVSTQYEATERFIVQPERLPGQPGRIALAVDGSHLADLSLAFYLDLDRAGRYLKVVRSDLAVHSVLDRAPLVRLEYRADMQKDPIAHWQVHAERGAFSHLLARAHSVRLTLVAKPHDLSSLHLPVGGERYRPCLEDLLEFLVTDCGVDSLTGWRDVVHEGRAQWRRRQLASAVRDVPSEAARVLREIGWTVSEPAAGILEHLGPLTKW